MNVICLEEEAFYRLVELTVERLRPEGEEKKDRWISDVEAMRLLRIKSKSTLQRLRDQGDIRFSQPMHKLILYDCESINEYLELHASK